MRIGIDLGGTKTEVVALDDHGAILTRKRLPTPSNSDYWSILEQIRSMVTEIEVLAGEHCTVGIGTPGAISAKSGLLRNSNTTCLNNRPLLEDLQILLDRELRIENDANCFALSEATDGAAAGCQSVFGVILGTGAGGGVVIDQKIHRGRHHIGGEWGHNSLYDHGPHCYCGKRGCVETLISGPGLMKNYCPDLDRVYKDPQTLFRAATHRDKAAEDVVAAWMDNLARALSMVINILDPEMIVLGGGLSNVELLYKQLPEKLAQYVFSDYLSTPIVRNMHGDSSGVRGAAWLWT